MSILQRALRNVVGPTPRIMSMPDAVAPPPKAPLAPLAPTPGELAALLVPDIQKSPGPEIYFRQPMPLVSQPEKPHLLVAAVVGPANAGKSSLVNALVRCVVSPVARLAHSTRERITAVSTEGHCQVVFTDTPGIVPMRHEKRAPRDLVTSSWGALDDTEHIVAVLDAHRLLSVEQTHVEDFFLRRLTRYSAPRTYVFNKCDLFDNPQQQQVVLEARLRRHLTETGTPATKPFFVSAATGDGVTALREHLQALARPHPHTFSSAVQSDTPPIVLLEQLVRHAFFNNLWGYIPYIMKHKTVHWDHRKDALDAVHEVAVPRANHEKIAVGHGGRIVKTVQESVRVELERILGIPVSLYLDVKFRKPLWS